MRPFLLIAVCGCLAALAAGRPQSGGAYDYSVHKAISVENSQDTSSSPAASLLQGLQQSQDLSGAQFVQHPQGGQSYYLAPMVQSTQQQQQLLQHQQQQLSQYQQQAQLLQQPPLLPQQQQQSLPQYQPQAQLQQQQQFAVQQPEAIQLQIPIPNDAVEEKKIILRLPPQQYPVQQPQFPYRIPPRKHYKIILVRSPTPAPTPAPQPVPEVEEQTLIYVLVKKPDEPSVAEQQKQIEQAQKDAIKFNKPEVYFIKYKANGQDKPTQQQQEQQQQMTAPSGGDNGYAYDTRTGRQLDNDAAATSAGDEPKDDEMMME